MYAIRSYYGNVTHAHFTGQQAIENLDAGGIAEELVQLAQVKQRILIGHYPVDLPDNLFVHVDILALQRFLFINHASRNNFVEHTLYEVIRCVLFQLF